MRFLPNIVKELADTFQRWRTPQPPVYEMYGLVICEKGPPFILRIYREGEGEKGPIEILRYTSQHENDGKNGLNPLTQRIPLRVKDAVGEKNLRLAIDGSFEDHTVRVFDVDGKLILSERWRGGHVECLFPQPASIPTLARR